MFKKLMMIAVVAAVPVAHACTYEYSAGPALTNVIKQRSGFEIPDTSCKLLEAAGMGLKLEANATVLSGVSIAWVSASVIDRNRVVSSTYFSNTSVNAKDQGSMDRAEQLMYEALVAAVRGLDVPKAIDEVRGFRRKAK